jgi:hypothetical protein
VSDPLTNDPDEYLRSCVHILPEALEEEFVRLPTDLAYWNGKYAEASREHLVAKMEMDRLRARLLIEHREKLMLTNTKVTESMVESAVEQDETYGAGRLRLIEAEVEKVRLHGALDAIRTKRDMLISLGAHVRAEMAGDPHLREEARGRRLSRDGY